MNENYENIIRRVILKKYPIITDVKVEDDDGHYSYFIIGSSFKILYKTDECLPDDMKQKISRETSLLVKFFPLKNNPFELDYSVKCYFDCGGRL